MLECRIRHFLIKPGRPEGLRFKTSAVSKRYPKRQGKRQGKRQVGSFFFMSRCAWALDFMVSSQSLQNRALQYNCRVSALLRTGGLQPGPQRRILVYVLVVRSTQDSLSFSFLVTSTQGMIFWFLPVTPKQRDSW